MKLLILIINIIYSYNIDVREFHKEDDNLIGYCKIHFDTSTIYNIASTKFIQNPIRYASEYSSIKREIYEELTQNFKFYFPNSYHLIKLSCLTYKKNMNDTNTVFIINDYGFFPMFKHPDPNHYDPWILVFPTLVLKCINFKCDGNLIRHISFNIYVIGSNRDSILTQESINEPYILIKY